MKPKLSGRRIFIAQDQILGPKVIFSSDNVRRLKDVLHLKPGDQIAVLDGARRYEVLLEKDRNNELIGEIINSYTETADFPLTVELAFGCVRPGPTEEIIRHCTELGVASFSPLLLEYSNRRPVKTRLRWLNVASSACAQSNRVIMPQINQPVGIDTFLDRLLPDSCRIYLSPEGGSSPLERVLETNAQDRLTLLIGSEGGLAVREESLLVRSGFLSASLGPTILRTETAAIVSVGIAMSWGLIRRQTRV
ncbi:MAG: 16S rRNA (uracil(1498)-N(3))-methyltransferase [Deltaproteobacteria bacterium]|nr:16S rRNA (uracil(1498)-N(3))-methyltransferase [Deltaproteobacteria bacterium]